MFDSYITSIWCVVITMTTVGYGDVYAVSPYGRIISILNALWGAFIISLLVASIGRIFDLTENQKLAIADITNSKRSAALLRAGIQYFNAKKERTRYERLSAEEKREYGDYVYTDGDLGRLKREAERQTELQREERKQNEDLVPEEPDEKRDIEVVKEHIIDLNDKFDFLVNLMIISK